MKRFRPVVCFIVCSALLIGGCQKTADDSAAETPLIASPAKAAQTATQDANQPTISFEETFHDFGTMSPMTTVTHEFKFKNTGSGLLNIDNVHAPCGCTIPEITKKQIRPGESEVVTVKYRAAAKAQVDTKNVYVYSNDAANPKVTLTIKAQIVNQVSVEPQKLNLSLRQENAACPDITLTSTDNEPFSIKSIESTADCVSIDVNSAVQATQFVLKPKIDIEKFRQSFGLEGLITIDISHSKCASLSILFTAESEFKSNPHAISILNAEPGKPVAATLLIQNKYNEPFELESVSSRMGYTKIVKQVKDPNGYTLDLQITPPQMPKNTKRMFSESIMVKIKQGEYFKIPCRGFYAKETQKTQN